jgi:phosphatidylglycerol:prolipoprotein diacylglycerol transferase
MSLDLLPAWVVLAAEAKKSLREVLVEIPGAQVLAGIAAGVAVVFALYYAVKSGGRDEKGDRRPMQIGPIAVSLVIAFVLVGGVVLNDEFRGKSIPIYSYGFMVMIGFAFAIFISSLRAAQTGLDVNVILDLGLWTMLAGIAGARFFHLLQFHSHYEGMSLLSFFEVWKGGLVFYGGLVGGALAGIIFLRMRRVSVARVADIVAPAIPLGVSFARFGCFLNGCCFGRACPPDFPFAVTVQVKTVSGPVTQVIHPTQLYSSLDAFIIFLAVALYSRLTFHRRIHWEVFIFFVLLYAVGRFCMEMLRNDTGAVFGTGGTIAQVLSVILVAVAGPLFVWIWVRKRRGEGTSAAIPPGDSQEPKPAGKEN